MPEPIVDPLSVITELDRLGLNEAQIRGAVEEGVKRHLFACTKNDPAPGIVGYDKITRALRDRLLPAGWKRGQVNRQHITYNPNTNVAIVVSTGDEFTGTEPTPSTRFKKGTATKRAVGANVASLADADAAFAASLPSYPRVDLIGSFQTYILLYFVDFQNVEIRAELSLPNRLNAEGLVCDWHTRIVVEPIAFDDDDYEGDIPSDEAGDDGITVAWG